MSLHGIEGAFSGSGIKTVIPSDVKGKFSMRLVPNQDPARIEKVIEKHFETEFAKVRSRKLIAMNFEFKGRKAI